jgi:hypothetical protein
MSWEGVTKTEATFTSGLHNPLIGNPFLIVLYLSHKFLGCKVTTKVNMLVVNLSRMHWQIEKTYFPNWLPNYKK